MFAIGVQKKIRKDVIIMESINNFSKQLLSGQKSKKLLFTYIKHILTIVTLPLLIANIILALLFINLQRNEAASNVRSAAERYAYNIDNLFAQIDTYYKTCISDNSIATLINNPLTINRVAGTTTPYASARAKATLLNEYTNCIDSIYLYSSCSDYIYTLYGVGPRAVCDALQSRQFNLDSMPDMTSHSTRFTVPGVNLLSFGYVIGNRQGSYGILIININPQTVIGKFNLINSNTTEINLTSDITGESLMSRKICDKKGFSYDIPLQNVFATLHYSEQRESAFFFSKATSTIYIIFLVLSIGLTILLALVFSRKQYNSVISVISAIETPYFTVSGQDKIYNIIKETSPPARADDDFEGDLLNKITNLKKSQVIALQTQINPHFLFNTLCMISGSIIANNEKDTEAVSMIMLLSDILRYSLKTDDCIVSLNDEINILKSYITILELRHRHSFEIEWDIAQEAYGSHTLKSIMQPIIENSIKHGIQKLYGKRKGIITIRIYTKDNALYFSVTDNGVGMSPQTLEELKNNLNSDTILQTKNIGLSNVICRIKLLFGNNAGYSITSDEYHTNVTIYHPIMH